MATSPGGVVNLFDSTVVGGDATTQPVSRKRLSFESLEGQDSKRLKLSDTHDNNENVAADGSGRRQDKLQVPAARNNGRLRLGV